MFREEHAFVPKGNVIATTNTFHLSMTAAEKYQAQKVPAVFGPLARATFAAITLPENAGVLDLACGTGIVTKIVAERLPGIGRIVGTDLNPAMIEVARQTMHDTRHAVEWAVADVSNLPFGDGEFDVAFCQQGLQFFPDEPAALRKIRRVPTPNGQLVLTVWSAISPLFQAVSGSLRIRVSEAAADQAVHPFAFRDGDVIAALLAGAGFSIANASTLLVQRPLTPARAAIRAEILATPYEMALRKKGNDTIDAIVDDVDIALERYRDGNNLIVPQEAHLFQAVNH
jgi:SAM-dependent methyltransferase